MNRQIKFRALDLENHEWVHGYLGLESGKTVIIDTGDGNATTKVDPATVGEFSGLKDKNGVEVYEDDFVEFHEGDQKDVYLVQFKFGAFYLGHHEDAEYDEFMTFGMDWSNGPDSNQLLSRSVIGNIHQNPELVNA